MAINPGRAVQAYISGKTQPFLNPITFLLIGVSIMTIGKNLGNEGQAEFIEDLVFQTKISVSFILTFALSNFLVFRFKHYSFLEQLTAAIFYGAFLSFVITFFQALKDFDLIPDSVFLATLIITTLYMLVSFQHILKNNWWVRMFILILSFAITAVLFYVLITLSNQLTDFLLKE